MKPLIRWRTLAETVWDAWPAWLFFLGLALGWVVALPFSATLADTVRCAGMVLQIAGLLTVAFGLRKLRCMFNRPSTRQNTVRWFRRVASAFTAPKVITAQMAIRPGAATLKGEGRAIARSNTELTLDQRLAVIEGNLSRLRDELDAKIHSVRQELAGFQTKLAEEITGRQAADQAIASTIEEVAVGGLHLEMIGLTWLVVGVIGTSVPDRVAGLLDWLF